MNDQPETQPDVQALSHLVQEQQCQLATPIPPAVGDHANPLVTVTEPTTTTTGTQTIFLPVVTQ